MVRLHGHRVVAIAAAGVLVGALAGCAKGNDSGHSGSSPAADRMILKVGTTDSVTSLDPAGPYDPGSRTLQANLYQTLLTILPGKPTPVPDAADCQFDTPTTYTCSLKSGLTFANGDELTSSDVKYSFDRMLRIKAPSGPAAMFSTLASVTTPDNLTVVFNLKKPDARLPYLLTTTAASVVDEQVYPADKLLSGQAVGSGPYRLTAYQAGKRATLAKFLGYHGIRAAQNDGVEVTFLKDSAELRQAVSNGKVDVVAGGLGPSDLDKLRAGGKVQVIEADGAETRSLAFNFRSPTARKPAVRRAVAQLIDRPAIAKRVYAGQVNPLYSVIPAGFGSQTDAFSQEYKEPNKAAAAAILREGAITGPVTLSLGWTPSHYGPGARAEAAEVKRQLEASGLFRVNLRGVEWSRYQQLAKAGSFDLFQVGWVPEFPDGDDFLTPIVRDGAGYQNGYKSQTAAKLLDTEADAQNQSERDNAFGQLQSVLAHDVPVLPIWQSRTAVVAGKNVRNGQEILNPLAVASFSRLQK
jgi:peptide/nickel transport system substrate-binding protein